jgi:predicted RNA-binding Zn-ribbon protein involved in translation (DUF1610 family)
MGVHIRIRFTRDQTSKQCPRCQSADIWRWAKDRSLFRPVALLMGRHLMTCRCCGHKFYVVKKVSDSPLLRFVSIVTAQGLEMIPGRRDSRLRTRPAHGLPMLNLSFDEWERRQAEPKNTSPTARAG